MGNEGLFTVVGPGGPGRPKGSPNREMHWARQLHSEHGREAMERVVDSMRDPRQAGQPARQRVRPDAGAARRRGADPGRASRNQLAGRRAINALNEAMGSGEITPEKADVAMRVIERQWRLLVATELEQEVEELHEIADEFLQLKRAVEEAKKKP